MKANDVNIFDFFVSPFEVTIIKQIPVPDHPNTRFDDDGFRDAVARSISLMPEEKVGLLQSIPDLTQEQVDRFLAIFTKEAARFAAIAEKFLVAADAEEAGREAVQRRAAFTVLPGGRA